MRKKIDNRIRIMVENGMISRHRSMFVVVGDKARDQVVILHHMLSKAAVKARPSVLWCYKKELGFSSHRKKRQKQLQKKIKKGILNAKEDDPFELFIASTAIRYCYYSETHKILGNTYGMCVLQDFEALSPNLLARTIETVEGGGLVVILLHNIDSLRQLFTLTMDVHARFRTEAHQDVIGRFNERFILSLSSCPTCIVLDDKLNILPLSSHVLGIEALPPRAMDGPLPPNEEELKALKASCSEMQPVGSLVNCCKTLDQGKAVFKFIEVISEKTLSGTVVLTAARGRGKSAALGIALASAVAFGYANLYVTAPSPENLKTLFEFVFKGFDALNYEEHTDYQIVQSTNPDFNKAVVRVNIYRDHRQTIQYIEPHEAHKLSQAELVCIDEAAAIPLPVVKALLGSYLVFMSSTINGYEGTGRSLSLKLIGQLRQGANTQGGRKLHEIKLTESIRYADEDPVEKWLYELLCLDATVLSKPMDTGCPLPGNCELYYVSRDTLFSYHPLAEGFLQKLMALYVSSHYKNTPNDLQMLSDAPAHHIFCLLAPRKAKSEGIPEILCVLQICLEGEISRQSIVNSMKRGKRASGDLIPWTVTQQFQDPDFGSLSGVRIVRIATHPDYQGMGYGRRAMELLEMYYTGKIPCLTDPDETMTDVKPVNTSSEVGLLKEKIKPRKSLPPLLVKLNERPAESLHYLGVSYGLTSPLLKFWKRAGFVPVYLRQTANELTGEHSCIMLKQLAAGEEDSSAGSVLLTQQWLPAYWADFRRRLIALLGYQFREFPATLALSLLQQKQFTAPASVLTKEQLGLFFTPYDLKRLELYTQNMADYHLITDLLPGVAKLQFQGQLDVNLSAAQAAILVGIGLQHKRADDCSKELEVPTQQVLGLFNRAMRKVSQSLHRMLELEAERELGNPHVPEMTPLTQSLEDELKEAEIIV